jgi:hypothetical protein
VLSLGNEPRIALASPGWKAVGLPGIGREATPRKWLYCHTLRQTASELLSSRQTGFFADRSHRVGDCRNDRGGLEQVNLVAGARNY